jgi:hypothetical protein
MDAEPTLPDAQSDEPKVPKPLNPKKNPFASGFVPTGPRKGKSGSFINKRSLLKMMLEIPLTVKDLPTWLADSIRAKAPGFLDNVERKFTMYQILEMTQLQLLFSQSDYVRQDAITAIKDRVEGKPMQKIQVENMEVEPTQFILPGGRVVTI